MRANISEIFYSVQGEGIFCGVRQLFIRFSGCNLNCYYCDTRYSERCMDYANSRELENPVSLDYIQNVVDSSKNIHSVSFTGGEPLLYANFIAGLEKTRAFYLESNMSLPEEARKLKHFDIIAGDLKVREALKAGYEEIYENTVKSFRILRDSESRVTFAKIVLPERFDVEDVLARAEGIADCVRCFVLQPVFGSDVRNILKLQEKMLELADTRVIPQVHKYLGVR
ncbi:7-carboxy-7-deazaguanine synthase QueE [Geoglobus acetivorans]|uniref:7-carboxy-7-deazaguanine synthase n=1 Tax=Geoglobus acetivorans TaxID=565033 RepID=A0A0A7GIC4_GEOAI|nr:Queuosine biosynthesis protein QueE [Geoglobus acetivorans]